ncbi:hypothetical protein [Aeromicrobium chenweiae]|uniref:Uncharacterized protein n=1 Tax=Aeromicrobium chenweiae TaxID=2079793 RepID=A0A2S0WHK5_9ACTN|nr:hypothetical protein [Aeromicrobium chenweiae]AWB90807.1 hypothetical protein C3E78_00350 [Aeromicrobium chenweiae]TGN31070.1 hypothetical protein E4L97_15820 [Aeromicrobium chenweiae]
MITVKWKTATGATGETQLSGDDKWTFGRTGGADDLTVSVDNPAVSRTALVIRDSGPGPVVFRGQTDNGAKVALVSVIGSTTWLDEGTAGNLTAEENRVELSIQDEVVVTVDVEFDDRGSVVERRQAQ